MASCHSPEVVSLPRIVRVFGGAEDARRDSVANRGTRDAAALSRETTLGEMLGRHLFSAQQALGLGLAPAVVSRRLQGLVVTLDLRRPFPAYLSNEHVSFGIA
jgi:hypothetical protein